MITASIPQFRKIIRLNRGYKKVTHCIFDFDGTILDTQPGYNEVAKKILEKFGKDYNIYWQRKLLGMTSIEMWTTAKVDFNLPASAEELAKQYRELSRYATKDRPFKPGVERLLCHLHRHNIPMAIATCSRSDTLEHKSDHIKPYMDIFHHIVCGGSDKEVKMAKPSPDIFLVCAARFPDKPKPECCLVFEDSPRGITAAICAGMQCVAIPEKLSLPDDCEHATLVLKSIEEFQPILFGLPPFEAD